MTPRLRSALSAGLKAAALVIWLAAFIVLFRGGVANPTATAVVIVVVGMLVFTAGRLVDRLPPAG